MSAETQVLEQDTTKRLCDPAKPSAVRILAKSTFRELKDGGLSCQELVSFTTELLDLVASDFSETRN